MTDTRYNTDFFENDVFDKKPRKPRAESVYSGHRVLPYIRVPIEYTVIICMIVLILMVVSYAIGVERGKKINILNTETLQDENIVVSAGEEIEVDMPAEG